MGLESSGVVKFDLGPLLQGQKRKAKIKSAYSSLIIGPRSLQCEINLQEIMGWKSSYVVRFDLRPLFKVKREQPNLQLLITCLLLVLVVCNVKPTFRKSWTGNLLLWSDLILGPFQGQTRRAKLQSAYNLLIIGPSGLGC